MKLSLRPYGRTCMAEKEEQFSIRDSPQLFRLMSSEIVVKQLFCCRQYFAIFVPAKSYNNPLLMRNCCKYPSTGYATEEKVHL